MSDTPFSWPEFLARRGATPGDTGAPDAHLFPLPDAPRQGFACALTHLGVIAASGDEAAQFLHNQLTNDVLGLDGAHARLAGYCSPKGRLLATLMVWKDGDRILLALPRALLPATLKRLQMFVLRSRVKLEDVSDSRVLIGLAAPAGAWAASLVPPPSVWERMTTVDAIGIRLPDADGLQRCLWAAEPAQAAAIWQGAGLSAAPSSLWRWTDILAGLPQVVDATRELFVPQMVNFELVGGVSFRKGCYPGQEIVARSQFLGKLKRRTLLAFSDAERVAAGTEVFSEADPGQPCGTVVNAERGPDGRIACLVEMKLALADSVVRLGSAEGSVLTFGELPYTLAEPA